MAPKCNRGHPLSTAYQFNYFESNSLYMQQSGFSRELHKSSFWASWIVQLDYIELMVLAGYHGCLVNEFTVGIHPGGVSVEGFNRS